MSDLETLRSQLISSISQARSALVAACENNDAETSAHYAHDGVSIAISADLNVIAGLRQTISLDDSLTLGLALAAQRTSEAIYLLDDVVSAMKNGSLDALLMTSTASAQAEVDYMSGYPQVLGWRI